MGHAVCLLLLCVQVVIVVTAALFAVEPGWLV